MGNYHHLEGGNWLTQVGDTWADNRRRFAKYRCRCGSEVVRSVSNVRGGRTRSCGCLFRKRHTTHGLSDTRAFTSWQCMLSRCEDANHPAFHNYGGRGIVVCDSWHDAATFIRDMGEPSEGMTLDRIDNDGNYEPGNCRWATKKQQCRNTRVSRFLTIRGETKTLIEWTESLGAVSYMVAQARLRRGWTPENAIFSSHQRPGPKKGGGRRT